MRGVVSGNDEGDAFEYRPKKFLRWSWRVVGDKGNNSVCNYFIYYSYLIISRNMQQIDYINICVLMSRTLFKFFR